MSYLDGLEATLSATRDHVASMEITHGAKAVILSELRLWERLGELFDVHLIEPQPADLMPEIAHPVHLIRAWQSFDDSTELEVIQRVRADLSELASLIHNVRRRLPKDSEAILELETLLKEIPGSGSGIEAWMQSVQNALPRESEMVEFARELRHRVRSSNPDNPDEADRASRAARLLRAWERFLLIRSRLGVQAREMSVPDDPVIEQSLTALVDSVRSEKDFELICSQVAQPLAAATSDLSRLHLMAASADDIRQLEEVHQVALDLDHAARIEILNATSEAARRAADEANQQLVDVTNELSRVKALGADAELATHFATFATNERRASKVYRVLTFGLFLATTGVGIALFRTLDPSQSTADWGTIISHVVVAVGLAGLGAYTARLAHHHRVNTDWSESVSVQLKTFDRFLGPITDETTRSRIYEDFARRVLGAPPSTDATAGSDAAGMSPSQLVDLLRLFQRP